MKWNLFTKKTLPPMDKRFLVWAYPYGWEYTDNEPGFPVVAIQPKHGQFDYLFFKVIDGEVVQIYFDYPAPTDISHVSHWAEIEPPLIEEPIPC